jgi:hypothetical protein
MPLAAVITHGIRATLSGSPDVGATSHRIDDSVSTTLSNGTGAGQANALFADTRTLAASGTEDLDLAGGLTDALGTALTFTAIKAIRVRAAAGNTNNVVITRPASNGFAGPFLAAGDGISVPPGGAALFERSDAAGWAVTAGTADLLTITNSGAGTGVTYTIELIGEV